MPAWWQSACRPKQQQQQRKKKKKKRRQAGQHQGPLTCSVPKASAHVSSSPVAASASAARRMPLPAASITATLCSPRNPLSNREATEALQRARASCRVSQERREEGRREGGKEG